MSVFRKDISEIGVVYSGKQSEFPGLMGGESFSQLSYPLLHRYPLQLH